MGMKFRADDSRRPSLRSVVIRLMAYPAIAYLTAGALFYFKQDTLLFPAPTSFEKATPGDRGWDMVWDEAAKLHEIGSNLLLVDYRGYGSSTRISPNEMTLDEDAEASLEYLLRVRRIPVGKVFVLGQLYLVPGAGHDDLPTGGGDALIRVLRKFVRHAMHPVERE
jgi:hypothetical protein